MEPGCPLITDLRPFLLDNGRVCLDTCALETTARWMAVSGDRTKWLDADHAPGFRLDSDATGPALPADCPRAGLLAAHLRLYPLP